RLVCRLTVIVASHNVAACPGRGSLAESSAGKMPCILGVIAMLYRFQKRTTSLVAVLILLVAAVQAQQTQGLPADKLEKIEKAISSQMSKLGIPGLSVAVVVDHKIRWSNGYGTARSEERRVGKRERDEGGRRCEGKG